MTQEELNKKLFDTVKNNDIDEVKEVLSLGADVNTSDSSDWTVLMEACWWGYPDIVRLLIEHGAKTDLKDRNGYTALMKAAWDGNTDIAELLIEAGADINIKDNNGQTAIEILQEEYPEKYRKWIEETVIKLRREKLQKEDLINDSGQDVLPDWNI
ncbi:MAG: ankyrin repeat domain-containing protein [Syntrophomonadaceae bacterium]|nr:ankyrin repeat domain-containing protein [Syntrophomonadaceae bacterium]